MLYPNANINISPFEDVNYKDGSFDVVIQQIIKEAKERMGVTVGTGKITNRNANGVFKERAEVIRTRVANDLPTFTHELGHYLDKTYNFSKLSELSEVLGDDRVSEYLELYDTDERSGEGFAEFMRVYLLNKEAARRRFPRFTVEFENALRNTRDYDNIENISRDIHNYMTADIPEKMSAAIMTRKKAQKLYKDTHSERLEKQRMDWVDAFAPIERTADFASAELG
jgi:hypothetical protein